MSSWHPQQFRENALAAGHDPKTVASAVSTGVKTIAVNATLPPVFTLKHLATETGVSYEFLRSIVERNIDPYRSFRIKKSVTQPIEDNYRLISIPDPRLMTVQRWINRNILSRGRVHHASGAYAELSDIKKTASVHCGARWLIKLDIRRFFESISEIPPYRVFRGLGYQPLIAFEMSRLCSRRRASAIGARHWAVRHGRQTISAYYAATMGYLPQGAPTSPMLANLSMYSFDEETFAIGSKYGCNYTRYADDIAFSTKRLDFCRRDAESLVSDVYESMGARGLSPHFLKTKLHPPGSRKVVLGLLVDGNSPRLTKEFKDRIRMHLYFVMKFGAIEHQRKRGFVSVRSLRNHIEGLISFAGHIEPTFAQEARIKLSSVAWPL
jgi:hypothetical protein